MPYQSGYAGEFEGWTRLELIQQVLRGLGSPVDTPGTDTGADYTRYPKQDIIDKLNEGQIKFVRKTHCLTTFAIVEAVGGQSEYRWPRNCLRILEAMWYTSATAYEQLRVVDDKSQMKRISTTWRTDASGTVEFYYPSYGYGNIRKFGVYPKPAIDGDTYSGTGYGIVTSATDFSLTDSVTGTHRVGAGDDKAYLEDEDGRDFTTLGITVGMMIFNNTDDSSGQITAISNGNATNDRLEVTLSGGTDDDFDEGDSFQVEPGEYGVVIRADGSEEWAFSSDLGALQDITPLSGNFLLDYIKRPFKLDTDNQYPEIPADYHNALVEYSVWKLGLTEYDGANMEVRATKAEEAWHDSINDYISIGKIEVEPSGFVEDRERIFMED